MAQSTILASGRTGAQSTDVVLASGAVAVVGLFTAGEDSQINRPALVVLKTPGADNHVAVLNGLSRQVQISGPGTFRVKRPALPADAAAYGVFVEQ